MVFNNKKYLLLILNLIFAFNLYAQNYKEIRGYVTSKEDNKPLPFVHIQIKGTGVGTISNINGYFSLKIPSNYNERKLLVSYIGYEPFEAEIKNINKTLQVRLEQANHQIGEVIIMPDSTLLTLLGKAFKKIPENYPNYPTSLTGFYRESVKTTNNEYAYFAEAVTETYKNSYTKKNAPGQVKILKSLVNELPKIDSLPMRFYGGVFKASSGDIVLRRGSYINPKNFKNYNYTLEGVTKFNNNVVYIISFDTKNNSLGGTMEGRFYLDKASLAYIFFEYQLTPKGLKKRSSEISINRNVKMLKKTINYVKLNDKWHFKHSKSTEHFIKGNNITWVKEDEYLTTDVQIDSIKPIPLDERLEYGDIFSEKAKSYQSEDYWEEYNILKKDSLLDKQLKLLYDTTQSKKLLTQKVRNEKNRRSQLIKIITKLGLGYHISYSALNAPVGMYSLAYDGLLNVSENFDDIANGVNFGAQLSYSLNHRWDIVFSAHSPLSQKLLTVSYDLGTSYRVLLSKKGKPISFYIKACASYNRLGRNFSTIENNTNFNFASKSFDANRLKAGIGYETFGFKPGISIEIPLKRLLFLQFSGAYYLPLYKEEKLFLKEKSGFFLTRKNASLPLSSDEIEASFNGEPTNKSHFSIGNYSFGLGLVLRY